MNFYHYYYYYIIIVGMIEWKDGRTEGILVIHRTCIYETARRYIGVSKSIFLVSILLLQMASSLLLKLLILHRRRYSWSSARHPLFQPPASFPNQILVSSGRRQLTSILRYTFKEIPK